MVTFIPQEHRTCTVCCGLILVKVLFSFVLDYGNESETKGKKKTKKEIEQQQLLTITG